MPLNTIKLFKKNTCKWSYEVNIIINNINNINITLVINI